MKTRSRLALSRALLLGTALGCGPLSTAPGPRPGVSDPELNSDGTDAGVVTIADAGSDAGVVRLYCWLITDPRCLDDGGTAPGTFDAC